ncbi:MAG: hypothetical protein ACTSQD_08065 [Promethearchaeota archaeon]
MSIMYCPNCQTDTFTKREDFRYLLAFLLAFTGIGLIIYILYYIDKKKDRCVTCDMMCLPRKSIENQVDSEEPEQINDNSKSLEFKPIELEKSKNFCHNCGEEAGEREGIKYCALCGISIE